MRLNEELCSPRASITAAPAEAALFTAGPVGGRVVLAGRRPAARLAERPRVRVRSGRVLVRLLGPVVRPVRAVGPREFCLTARRRAALGGALLFRVARARARQERRRRRLHAAHVVRLVLVGR